ncbi:MAG: hypothetical protein GX364_03640 [Firmicutes bacterium]|jgi:hypothetical protein|nr:hypothetical protein [Bacillota bacterium]
MAELITNLGRLRDNLLREYMLARGLEKATVLTRIIDIDEQIENERERRGEKIVR